MAMNTYTEDELDILRESYAEYKQNDPVHRDVRYAYFVSCSKGIRNGKRRFRNRPKEICLLSYRGSRFISWHLFAFDEVATECFGDSVSLENAEAELISRIESVRREGRAHIPQ